MFYTKVTRLDFNNGESLDISPNDIVVFVGPNNSGKSQSLTDIYNKIETKGNSIVIQNVEIRKGDYDELKEQLEIDSIVEHNQGQDYYKGYNYSIPISYLQLYNSNDKLTGFIKKYLVSLLKTEDRLKISNPPSVIDETEAKTHPIHYIETNIDYQRILSFYFKEAFGYELIPNFVQKKALSLCMGPEPILEGGNIRDIQKQMCEILNSYPKVHEQGDGMRSFVGVILHLTLRNYGIYLIDEPESFLHPPQANILGKVIGELLGVNRQAFIATHSEDIIKGLMERCPERIKIIRLTRNDNSNSFSVLRNDQFLTIWNDPLLRYSNIMSSLFHKNVVVCEADSDCRFYSMILDHLKSIEGSYSETLFVYSGSKNRLNVIIDALRSLSIDFRCIPDIDVLDDETKIKELFKSCGGEWTDELSKNYRQFSSNLNGGKTTKPKNEIQQTFNSFIGRIPNQELSTNDLNNLFKELKIETKWGMLKLGGKAVIPSGDAKNAYDFLDSAFQSVNLYLVPVGELERFVSEVGGHGPKFINNVLDKYPDFNNPVYDQVKVFVTSWKL